MPTTFIGRKYGSNRKEMNLEIGVASSCSMIIFLITQRIKPQLYSFFLNNTGAAKIYTDKQSP